jgi:hypothetical protein
MALQASLSLSLKVPFDLICVLLRRAKYPSSNRENRLQNQDIPPGIHQDYHPIQAKQQSLAAACLMIAGAPIFDFSLQFFFNPFHSNSFPFLYNEHKVKLSPPIRVNPTPARSVFPVQSFQLRNEEDMEQSTYQC